MDMAEAHARDSAAEQEFRRLAREIDRLLVGAHGERLHPATRRVLEVAATDLRKKAAHIVAVWD